MSMQVEDVKPESGVKTKLREVWQDVKGVMLEIGPALKEISPGEQAAEISAAVAVVFGPGAVGGVGLSFLTVPEGPMESRVVAGLVGALFGVMAPLWIKRKETNQRSLAKYFMANALGVTLAQPMAMGIESLEKEKAARNQAYAQAVAVEPVAVCAQKGLKTGQAFKIGGSVFTCP